jgi:hypothetical protein
MSEGLSDLAKYLRFDIPIFNYFLYPFFALFQTLANLHINLSTVNVSCAGSQAPIELLIDCCILGLTIVLIKSDYQYLFNILLPNINNAFLMNSLEKGSFLFNPYVYYCIAVMGVNALNPFQVCLRYAIGYITIASFGANHYVAHQVTPSCDQVPSAPYFDSLLGYGSSLIAWWLILPTIYTLASVVVPCPVMPEEKVLPLDDLPVISSYFIPVKSAVREHDKESMSDDSDSHHTVIQINEDEHHTNNHEKILRSPATAVAIIPDIPKPSSDHHVNPQGGLEMTLLRKELSQKFNLQEEVIHEILQSAQKSTSFRQPQQPSSRLSMVTSSTPHPLHLHQHHKPFFQQRQLKRQRKKENKDSTSLIGTMKHFLIDFCSSIVSVDIWLTRLVSSWIHYLHHVLQKDNPALYYRYCRQNVMKQSKIFNSIEEFTKQSNNIPYSPSPVKMLKQMQKQQSKKILQQQEIDSQWKKEEIKGLPKYHSLCLMVKEELNEDFHVAEPFGTIFAFLGIGHFFTEIGRFYWSIIYKNYQVFFLVCFGIWTETAVRAYDLETLAKDLSLPSTNSRERLEKESRGVQMTSDGDSDNMKESDNGSGKEEEDIDDDVMGKIIAIIVSSRVILFQFIPIFSIFSIAAAAFSSTPLFVLSSTLQKYVPAFLVWNSREIAWRKEFEKFPTSTKAFDSFLLTINDASMSNPSSPSSAQMFEYFLTHYSWRISFQSTIIFWSNSRLFCFVNAVDTILISFFFLFYQSYLIWVIVLLLAILLPFIFTRIMVLMMYFGKAIDLQDEDLSWIYRPSFQKLRVEFAPLLKKSNEKPPKAGVEDPLKVSENITSISQRGSRTSLRRSHRHRSSNRNRADRIDEADEKGESEFSHSDSNSLWDDIDDFDWEVGEDEEGNDSKHSSNPPNLNYDSCGDEDGSIHSSFQFSAGDSDSHDKDSEVIVLKNGLEGEGIERSNI